MTIHVLFIRSTILVVGLLAISNPVVTQTGKTNTADQLVGELSDGRVEVRRRAALDISELGFEAITAVPALSAALKDDHAAVRSEAALAISRIGPESAEAVPNLMLLLKDQDPITRQRAVTALHNIGPAAEPAVEALKEALNDNALDNSTRAAMALGRIGESAIVTLIGAMSHPNAQTRGRAVLALKPFGGKAKEAIPALLTALQDSDDWVRIHACWVLGDMGADAKEALPSLGQRLTETKRANLFQFYLAQAMLEIDPSAEGPVEVLKSNDMMNGMSIYSASAMALVPAEAEAALPLLIESLEEEPSYKQDMAIQGIRRLGPKIGASAVPKLQAIARNGQAMHRLEAAEALVTLTGKPEELLTVIEQVLATNSSDRRSKALKALAMLGPQGKESAEKVIPLLKDNDWAVREAARNALVQIDNSARFADAQGQIGEPANRDPYFTPTAAKSTSYMPPVIIRNIREDRDGNIWFATFGGPIRYDGKDFTNFSEEVGLAKTRVFSLLEDRSGALWFGSITGGATRYDGKSFTKFTEKEGLGNNDVTWIFEDRDANIWFGTGNGVSRYDGKSMSNFTTKEGLVHNSVYTIAQDVSGRIWFGTQGGICSYDGKSFSNLADQVGRSFVNIRAMIVDRSGNLWFGGQEGAFRYDGKTLTTFTSKEGLLDDFVGSMIVDRAGNLWLGHPGQFPGGRGGGASRYDGTTFKHFTQKDGLGSLTVYAMLEDNAGNIWFGSADAGACQYDGKTFTNFSPTTPPSIPAKSVQESAPAPASKVDNPMANFARMVGGEWRVTFTSGTSMYDTCHWGPGKHSGRVMTHGQDAAGNPWRGLGVVYWHPGRKQLCTLNLNPYEGSVSEDTITVEGETTEAVSDLYQNGVRRRMVSRITFDGPDKYHSSLLEEIDPGKRTPLAEWDYIRSRTLTPVSPLPAENPPKPSERMKVFELLLGRIWDARGNWGGIAGDAFHIESTFEWIPHIDAIYARSFALRGNGEPIHLHDAYIYHHTGTNRLRCLALSNSGGVYEGDITVIDGGVGGVGGLQLDLKGYEGERVVPYIVRFDFEKDGTLHQRAWSVDGAAPERTLMLDVHHTASEMGKGIWYVFQDANNNYWFGSDGQGVYRFDGKPGGGGAITHFTTKDGLCNDRIRGIQQHPPTGDILITTLDGVSKYDGQQFVTLPVTIMDAPDKGWVLNPDDVWLPWQPKQNGPYRYDGKTLYHLKFPKSPHADAFFAKYPNVPYGPYEVYCVYKDSRGHMWFGTSNLGICRFDGKNLDWIYEEHLTNTPEGGSFGIRSIFEDKDGAFWFCNTQYRYKIEPHAATEHGNGLITYTREKGMDLSGTALQERFFYFMSITNDSNGDLWMATYGGGVWRYNGKNITHYPVKDGDKDVTLFSIYKDNIGDLWLGTHEAGAYRFNGKTFEKFRN